MTINTKVKKLLTRKVSLNGCIATLNKNNLIFTKGEKENTVVFNVPEMEVFLETESITIFIDEAKYTVAINNRKKFLRSIVNTMSKLVNNAVCGLNNPYHVVMKIVGTGYKFEVSGRELYVTIGLSHKKCVDLPISVLAEVKGDRLHMKSHDKQTLFNFAKSLIKLKGRIDVYKGTGIFFEDQIIKLKEIKKK